MSGSGISTLLALSYGSGVVAGDKALSRQYGEQENPWAEKIAAQLDSEESTYAKWVMDGLSAQMASMVVLIMQKKKDIEYAANRISRSAGGEINMIHRHGIERSLERWQPRLNADGYKAMLLWYSALLPTTREWHASRHGKIYTSAEVEEFYQDVGNLCNCHCTVIPVVVDSEGKVAGNQEVTKNMRSVARGHINGQRKNRK